MISLLSRALTSDVPNGDENTATCPPLISSQPANSLTWATRLDDENDASSQSVLGDHIVNHKENTGETPTQNQIDEIIEYRRQLWSVMMTGLMLGFLGMHLMVVRPVKQHVAVLERQLFGIRNEMDQLVGSSGVVAHSNTLLSRLNRQEELTLKGRAALSDINDFRQKVVEQSDQMGSALASIDQITTLQDALIAQRQMSEPAMETLHEMIEVQNHLGQAAGATEEAEDALRQLVSLKNRALAEIIDADLAESGLQQIIDLKLNVIAEADSIKKIQPQLREMSSTIRNVVRDASDVAEAREITRNLVSLKDEVINRGGDTQLARQNMQQLFSLRNDLVIDGAVDMDVAYTNLDRLLILHDDLGAERIDFDVAGQNLESLFNMHAQLTRRSRQVASQQNDSKVAVEAVQIDGIDQGQPATAAITGPWQAISQMIELSGVSMPTADDVFEVAQQMAIEANSINDEIEHHPSTKKQIMVRPVSRPVFKRELRFPELEFETDLFDRIDEDPIDID